jgi:flagellin-like hook-associated protein FlgL
VLTFVGVESDGTAFSVTFALSATSSITDVLAALNAGLATDSASFDATTGNFVIAATATFGATPLTVSFTIDDDGGGAPAEFSALNVVRNAGNLNDGVLTVGGGQAVQVIAGQTVTVLGPVPPDPSETQPQITFTLGATITEGTDTLTIVQQAFTGRLNGGQTVSFQNGDQEIQFRGGSSAGFPSGETVLIDFGAIVDLDGGTSRTFVISAVNNSLNFQIGANAGQNVQIAFGDLGADNLGFTDETQPNGNPRVVSSINVTTLTGANEALAIVDVALNQVNRQRSALGAFTNRLEATIANLGVAAENLTASESRIRDADIAFETARFTRNQILVQAGISILGQANLLPQGVLQLLQ